MFPTCCYKPGAIRPQPAKKENAVLIKDGWHHEDMATGLTLTIIGGDLLNHLRITGIPGAHTRDFFFTKDGEFDGTGSFLADPASPEPEENAVSRDEPELTDADVGFVVNDLAEAAEAVDRCAGLCLLHNPETEKIWHAVGTALARRAKALAEGDDNKPAQDEAPKFPTIIDVPGTMDPANFGAGYTQGWYDALAAAHIGPGNEANVKKERPVASCIDAPMAAAAKAMAAQADADHGHEKP